MTVNRLIFGILNRSHQSTAEHRKSIPLLPPARNPFVPRRRKVVLPAMAIPRLMWASALLAALVVSLSTLSVIGFTTPLLPGFKTALSFKQSTLLSSARHRRHLPSQGLLHAGLSPRPSFLPPLRAQSSFSASSLYDDDDDIIETAPTPSPSPRSRIITTPPEVVAVPPPPYVPRRKEPLLSVRYHAIATLPLHSSLPVSPSGRP